MIKIPSINYHLWEQCNMNCRFCFSTFQDVKSTILPTGHLSRKHSLKIVEEIIHSGFNKITFAGGEPVLCPWIDELIIKAKEGGLTTMIVTNGSRLSNKILDKVQYPLDWVALSIDSVVSETLLNTGRVVRNKPMTEDDYLIRAIEIHKREIRLKLNTVVTSKNCNENLSSFVNELKPERWKIMQVLPVLGQNDKLVKDLLIEDEDFEKYIFRNSILLKQGIKIISEDNDAMKGSYVMIDPAGRFFDNVDQCYFYSDPIIEIGIEKALSQVRISLEKFIARDGIYN